MYIRSVIFLGIALHWYVLYDPGDVLANSQLSSHLSYPQKSMNTYGYAPLYYNMFTKYNYIFFRDLTSNNLTELHETSLNRFRQLEEL